MNRLGWSIDRCRRFNWRFFLVIHDCSMLSWAWLFWSGNVWLVPHTPEEADALLLQIAGLPRDQDATAV